MSIGFDRDRGRRQQDLTVNKIRKGKFHLRIMLKEVFGFAEHQEITTYGIGYKLTLTRKKYEALLDKTKAITGARNKIDHGVYPI